MTSDIIGTLDLTEWESKELLRLAAKECHEWEGFILHEEDKGNTATAAKSKETLERFRELRSKLIILRESYD